MIKIASRYSCLAVVALSLLVPVQGKAQPPGFPGQVPTVPVGYASGGAGSVYAPAPPTAYMDAAAAGDPWCYPGSQRQVDPDAWDGNGPIESFLTYMVKQSSFRLDYMLWSIDEPGMKRMGAPVAGVRDTSQPFEVFDRATGVSRGQATVPDLYDTSLRDVNGIRGTFTLPMRMLDFELNFWGTQQTGDQQRLDVFPGGDLVATSLLLNGEIANNTVNYDTSYTSDLTTELWGTEGNFVWNDPLYNQFVDGVKMQIRPVLGFRFLNLKERLQQTGTDTLGGLAPPRTAVIDSETSNNVYGPQIGVRAEIVHRFFTLGVQPKIMFGLNDYSAQVRTDQIFTTAEATRITRATRVDFTPIFELNAYAKVHLTENFSLHVGYDFMWTNRVTRPYNNIYYDEIRLGGTSVPNIILRDDLEDFFLQGLTVGGEIRL